MAHASSTFVESIPTTVRWLARSGILTGLSTVSIVGTVSLVVGARLQWKVLLFTAAVGFASYAFDHACDAIPRSWSNTRGALARIGVGLLLSAGFYVTGRELVSELMGMVGALYPASVAVYLWVKQVPYAKSVYVPALWGVLVLVPASTTETPAATVVTLFLWVVAKVVVGVWASDLKDVVEDRARNLTTMASRLSRASFITLLQRVNAATGICILVAVGVGVLPWVMVVVELHTVLVAATLLRLKQAGPSEEFFLTEVVLDAGYAMTFPLALLALICV